MDHKMSKDLPMCFEEQLRRQCPALFQINENPLAAMRQVRPDQMGVRPEFEPGNEPGDEAGNAVLNPQQPPQRPQAAPQRPLPQAAPGQEPVGRQKLAPLARKRGEQQAAEQMRQKVFQDMQGLDLDAMNQIAKQVRYLKMARDGKQATAIHQRAVATNGPAPTPGWGGR